MHPEPLDSTISDEAIEWFSILRSDHVRSEDRIRFQAWQTQSPLHAKAYADIEKFWALLDEPAQRVWAGERAQIASKTGINAADRLAKSRFGRKTLCRAWAALALVALVVLGFWLRDVLHFWTSDYHTDWGEQREIMWEDRSRITLNSHSALSVEFTPGQRRINLSKDVAYLQVNSGPTRPVIFATGRGIARVPGSRFNPYEAG